MSRRICMLVRSNLATDSRVRKEAESLRQAGYEVAVVGLGSTEATVEIAPRLTMHTLVHDPGYPQVSKVSRLVLATYAEPSLLRRMARVAIQLNPDIVHAHDLDTFPAAARVAKRLGAKLVFDSHELYAEMISWGFLRPFLRAYERHAIRTADLVITASEERAEEYVRHYGAQTLPTAILNVPKSDARRSEPLPQAREARERTGAETLLIYQGSAGGSRGLESVIEGVSLLPQEVHLALQGNALEASLAPLADSLGVTDRVHFWPAVPSEDVIGWAAAGDMGVVAYLPVNRNNVLCAPNKLYDYAAACVPVIASDLPPLRDAIETYGIGELFEPGSAESFAAAVLALSEPDLLRRAACATDAVIEGCNWEAQSEVLVQAYATL